MKELKVRNEQLRERFSRFLENNYNPQLRVLAKVIGISYQNLASWNAGSLEYGIKTLTKIELFLESKGE
jgi:hypothetical protein